MFAPGRCGTSLREFGGFDHLPAADVHRDVPDDRVLVEEEVARTHRGERDRPAVGDCAPASRGIGMPCARYSTQVSPEQS